MAIKNYSMDDDEDKDKTSGGGEKKPAPELSDEAKRFLEQQEKLKREAAANSGGSSAGGTGSTRPAGHPEPKPGEGDVLPNHPHGGWVMLLIRQRFLQGLKDLDDPSATLANAPTAQQIVDELCTIQYGTTDPYGNVIPNDPQSKVNKVKALRALKKKVTYKIDKDTNEPDLNDRDCVQAYLDEMIVKTTNPEKRYNRLREDLFDRTPKPTSRVERREAKKQKEKAKKTSADPNWTAIVISICVTAVVLALILKGCS